MYIAYPKEKGIFFLYGTAEREESFKLLQVNTKSETTVGEDRGYNTDLMRTSGNTGVEHNPTRDCQTQRQCCTG
ncbi:hypothetical protein [Nitrosomonas sp. Nm33]|uniref:hypothetical protein n=1 Tax=Nitrosomonas sp. Nm33 TaxID=133724 RepID=UPI000899E856|nr:hypothetical protein [Nitrosomonas sp. Nm33]SDY85699.1 hypothetical protein SAMN05421755_10563 [Nitrosomonas sp. Nm33]